MILPSKHVTMDQSILGIGGVILAGLSRANSVTAIWESVHREIQSLSFERFSLALDFLFLIGAVELKSNLIRRAVQ